MATRHYHAVIEPASGTTGFGIRFPAFPGTTSFAEKPGDLATQAMDALASVVEDMEADGEPLPASFEDAQNSFHSAISLPPGSFLLLVPVEVSGKAVRVNISLNEGILGNLDKLAQQTGTSRSAVIARGIRMVIEAEKAA